MRLCDADFGDSSCPVTFYCMAWLPRLLPVTTSESCFPTPNDDLEHLLDEKEKEYSEKVRRE